MLADIALRTADVELPPVKSHVGTATLATKAKSLEI